jgi:hypothetical protein
VRSSGTVNERLGKKLSERLIKRRTMRLGERQGESSMVRLYKFHSQLPSPDVGLAVYKFCSNQIRSKYFSNILNLEKINIACCQIPFIDANFRKKYHHLNSKVFLYF